jgi:hypothetical protein
MCIECDGTGVKIIHDNIVVKCDICNEAKGIKFKEIKPEKESK